MSLPILIVDEAKAQLRHGLVWWSENRSTEQALRWWAGIHDAITTLSQNPMRCGLARENPRYDEDLRELHFGLGPRPTHRVLFVVDDDAVRILTVRHAAQDDWQPPA